MDSQTNVALARGYLTVLWHYGQIFKKHEEACSQIEKLQARVAELEGVITTTKETLQ